jgi:MFS family permease
MIATVEMLGKAPVPIFAGKMADKFGYSVTFAAGAFISGLFLLLLIPLHKTRDVPSEAVS